MNRSRQRAAARPDEDGLTLLELVVALALFMIVMVGALRFVNQSTRQTQALAEMNDQQSASRRAASTLVNDLRQAWTGLTNKPRLESLTATSFVFYAPDRTPGNGVRLRKIRYALDLPSRTLRRAETLGTANYSSTGELLSWSFPTTDNAAVIVLPGVDNTDMFTFVDVNKNPTTVIADVDAVQVKLKVDRIANKFPEPDYFETSIQLRGA